MSAEETADSAVRPLIGRVFLLLVFSSGGSVCNVYAEEEEEEEDGESSAATQQSLENSITMNKMKLLKAKMEDMNLSKKVGSCWHYRLYFLSQRANVASFHLVFE